MPTPKKAPRPKPAARVPEPQAAAAPKKKAAIEATPAANPSPATGKRQTNPKKGQGKSMRVGRGRTVVKPGPDGVDPTDGGKFCGARKQGRPGFCRERAGARTDHVGEGRCWRHGGATPARTGGRYSGITKRQRISELLSTFEHDPDPMNLLPELAFLRATVLEFVERYDEMFEGLMRWNMSFSQDFQSDHRKWWRETRKAMQMDVADGDIEDMPDPMDYVPRRPVTVVDISTVGGLLAQVGAMVDRINKMREDKTYSLATISRLYEVMGFDLDQVAREVITDDSMRDALLDAVEARWKLIQLSGLTGPRARTNAGTDEA